MVMASRLADLAASIRAGNFEIVSGVLPAQGGGDEGPDPHQLVESALAACTIITVQMYANRKNWPLEAVNVVVKIEKEGPAGALFKRDISFSGSLTDEQTQRLFEIANKCPIHKLLESKIEVQSSLVAAPVSRD